jgi:hypothetical protein
MAMMKNITRVSRPRKRIRNPKYTGRIPRELFDFFTLMVSRSLSSLRPHDYDASEKIYRQSENRKRLSTGGGLSNELWSPAGQFID